MDNERAYLVRVAAAQPSEFCDLVLQAGVDEQRLLRIYLGDEQFEEIRALAAQTRGLRDATSKRGNVVVLHGIMGGELSLFNDDGQDVVCANAFYLVQRQLAWIAPGTSTGR